jgi:hypothetical protein
MPTATRADRLVPRRRSASPAHRTTRTVLRARYYDPEIGRFLSGDPLGGRYGYAAGNPVNFLDPSGLWTICNSWDSEASLATGQRVGAMWQTVDVVWTSQLVLDSETHSWVQPFEVDHWMDGDWACSGGQGICASQIDLGIPPSQADEIRASGNSSDLYDWYIGDNHGDLTVDEISLTCDDAWQGPGGTIEVSGCESGLDMWVGGSWQCWLGISAIAAGTFSMAGSTFAGPEAAVAGAYAIGAGAVLTVDSC